MMSTWWEGGWSKRKIRRGGRGEGKGRGEEQSKVVYLEGEEGKEGRGEGEEINDFISTFLFQFFFHSI